MDEQRGDYLWGLLGCGREKRSGRAQLQPGQSTKLIRHKIQ